MLVWKKLLIVNEFPTVLMIVKYEYKNNRTFQLCSSTPPPNFSRAPLRARVPRFKKQCSTPLTNKKTNLLQETEEGEVEGTRKQREQ